MTYTEVRNELAELLIDSTSNDQKKVLHIAMSLVDDKQESNGATNDDEIYSSVE